MKKKLKINNLKNEKTFEQGFKEFIRYCEVRNLRPATINTYSECIKFIWYKFYKPESLIKDITKEVFDDFVMFLKKETKEKDTSISSNIRKMRTVLYYFMKLGYMNKFNIKNIKVDRDIIETYTDEELKILLEKPNLENCSFVSYRNWTIINCLLACGCRISSLINLKIEDLDFTNELITFTHTKNRKRHIVPMSLSLKNVLMEYIQYRQAENKEDYLFVTAFGEKCNRVTLVDSINTYNRKRGVMRTGVHKFRHTFAKKWVLSGGNIFKLQKILQHSSMEMVKNYVNIFNADLSNDFNEFNPLELLQAKPKNHISMRGGRG
ncbi:site-specific integrase [Clostridium sp. DJ247]|uniref:tyrosine-type recombinase/integrase n=1 Tax=Clostridium sp. DJ247 TaxID=2726188 RepID=UPI0016288962|nr:site-specific integrase [Clostridium sp. DJ247]MBC2580857.1 tyrosine-type recombinase/integrase [Clostridium sp. DJ247]